MSQITRRAIAAKSSTALVVISPASTTSPVVSSVSTATRDPGSSASAASTIASEIWSASLSGWLSVTDSEVNRNPSPSFMTCRLPVSGMPVSGMMAELTSSDRTSATPATMARSFCLATSGLRCRSPQSGLTIRRSAGT